MASEINEFHSSLSTIRGEIDRFGAHVTDDVTRNTAAVTSGLSAALSTLEQVAHFIGGDFDNRPLDTPEKADLLNALTSGCELVHTLTVKLLGEVGNEHTKAVELRVTEVIPLIGRITNAKTTVQNAVAGLNAQIHTTNQTLQHGQKVLEDNAEAFSSASRKLAEAEQISGGVSVAYSWLIPIGPGPGLGGIGPLKNMVDSARSAVNTARDTLSSTLMALRKQRDERQGFLELEHVQLSAAAELPGLSNLSDAYIHRIQKIEAGIITAVGTSTEAVRRAGRFSNADELTAALSISKNEFAEGILDVLEALLMEPAVAPSARSVLAALAQGYDGGGVPKALQVRSSVLEVKLAHLREPLDVT